MTETSSDAPSQTIKQFCDSANISRATFFKTQRLGIGPKVMRVPGTRIVRVTETRNEWHERMAESAQQEAAKLEQQRRVEQARTAGYAAARSPLHISRRQRRD
jgi:hypothetical protein